MAVAPLELRWLRLLLAWRAVEAVVFSPQVEPELQAMGGGIWDAFIVIVTYHIILYIYKIFRLYYIYIYIIFIFFPYNIKCYIILYYTMYLL